MKKTNLWWLIVMMMIAFIGGASWSSDLPVAQADEPTPQIGEALYIEGGEVSSAFSGCGGEIPVATNAEVERQVVVLVNQYRLTRGLPPLKAEIRLFDAARYQAVDMGQDDYFEHNTHDRSGGTLVPLSPPCDLASRLQAYNYNFISAAENIAAGQTTAQQVMDSWLGSPGHRENIESTTLWEIGVGYYAGSGSQAPYWVQNFGRRETVYPVIINNEAITTASINVSLYVYGRDQWSEICIYNDGAGCGVNDWQPFNNSTFVWPLNNIPGERTVSVQMRNGGDVSDLFQDTIILATDGATPTPANDNLPDLVVNFMAIELNDNRSCGSSEPLGVRVTFSNVGNVSAGPFVLQVNNQQLTINGLAAGQQDSRWFEGYLTGDENVALIDSTNQVIELNEANNTFRQLLPVPTPIPTCTPIGRPTSPPGATATPTATAIPPTPTATSPVATNTPPIRPTVDNGSTATPVATNTPPTRPTVDGGSTATPIATNTPVPSTTISGIVRLQGRTDYQGAQVLISEAVCGNEATGTAVATTNNVGYFEFSATGQNQCLWVVADNYLNGQRVVPQGVLGEITLPAGDMNDDGTIDIFDVAFLGLRYQGDDLTADLNVDGRVDIFDIALVAGNYQRVGPVTNWQ